MAEKMRDGIIKRGSVYYYVVRERVTEPVLDPGTGEPTLDANGRPVTKTKTKPRWIKGAPTREATKAMRDEARSSVRKGTYVAPQDLTVAQWLDQWIDGHQVELKPSTAASYREKIRLYLKPAIGHQQLQALSPSLLSAVWRDMQAQGGRGGKPVSVRTVEFARAVLRKALEDAVVERVIPLNPVTGSKMPKRDGKPKHTTWTGQQMRLFLDRQADDRWAAMWELFAATGMRRGEVAGLRWSEVDLEAGTVAVERSTTQLGNERVTTTPKNHERRTIGLDAHTLSVLKAWRKQQAAEKLAMGPTYADREDLVFAWEDGRPLMPNYITKVFAQHQAAITAGLLRDELAPLPRLTVHELRHTHATILLRAGVPVHIVAKRLGHKDPSVTLNVYADWIPDDDATAVDVFGKAVWGA